MPRQGSVVFCFSFVVRDHELLLRHMYDMIDIPNRKSLNAIHNPQLILADLEGVATQREAIFSSLHSQFILGREETNVTLSVSTYEDLDTIRQCLKLDCFGDRLRIALSHIA